MAVGVSLTLRVACTQWVQGVSKGSSLGSLWKQVVNTQVKEWLELNSPGGLGGWAHQAPPPQAGPLACPARSTTVREEGTGLQFIHLSGEGLGPWAVLGACSAPPFPGHCYRVLSHTEKKPGPLVAPAMGTPRDKRPRSLHRHPYSLNTGP